MIEGEALSNLISGVRKAAWAAISNDEERIVAIAPYLQEVLKTAKEAGVPGPVVIRVLEADAAILLL